jgi:hypothetical protein
MEELTPGAIAALGGLIGGMGLGFAARWGRFCTLGAIEDATLGNNRGRLSAWLLAIAIAISGTFGLDHAGLITLADSFYLVSPTSIIATAVGPSCLASACRWSARVVMARLPASAAATSSRS